MNEPVQADLHEMLSAVAEVRGWKFADAANGSPVVTIVVTGKFSTYPIRFAWLREQDKLLIRVATAISGPLAETACDQLRTLLNAFNNQASMGAWFFDEDKMRPFVVWRYELHTDLTTVDDNLLEKIIDDVLDHYEQMFPALLQLVSEKPKAAMIDGLLTIIRFSCSVDEALSFIDEFHQYGRA